MYKITFFNVVGYSIDGEEMYQVIEEVLHSEQELSYYLEVVPENLILGLEEC